MSDVPPGPRDDDRPPDDPQFGPRGYLPERAAKRARKIVLRAPMGMQWVIGALVAGVLVAIAGGLLLTRDRTPGPPFVALGPVADVAGAVVHDDDLDVLVVGLSSRVRVFDAPADVTYCEESRRLEAPDGQVWSLTGRAFAGGTSLREHPTTSADGVLYVDPTAVAPAPAASPDVVEVGCG
jgi:hypothetical protein